MIKKKFNNEISERTISNWIFSGAVPFGNEKTQFKRLPTPKKQILYEEYINKKLSSQKIAEKYKVSTIIVIKLLKEFSVLSPEKAYILEVLCGDRYINKKAIRFEIRKDEEFIKKFSNCFKEVYGLNFSYNYYKKRDSFVLYVSPEIICKDLLNYGRFGCFEWRVPKEIMESEDANILCNFLRGIYDSEGCVTKSSIIMSSSNKEGIRGVKFLLKKLGIKSKIGVTKKRHYILWIFRKERFKIFRDKIGLTINRKQNKLNELLKNDRVYKSA